MDKKPIHEELERRPKEVATEAVERNRRERGQGESEESFLAKKSVAFIAGILILFGLYLSSLYNYLLFHTLAEIFSIVVACGIFIIAWNSRRILANNYLLFLGIAFLFIGALDLVHTLAYKGMNVFQGYETNLPTQLWIATRYIESLSLLIAPVFLTRRLRANLVLMAYALATFLLLGSIFYWHIFPTCFVAGVGLTPFKKISEYIISIILTGAITVLFQKRKEFDERVFRLLVVSIAFTIASELAFTFYIHAYGFSNLVGHYLKLISFYLIYKAIIETGLVRPYNLLFRNLKQSEETLRRSESFLNSIINQSPHAMWISDKNGTLISINPACCKLLNLTEEEVIGKYNVLRDNIVEEQGRMPLVKSVFEEGNAVEFNIKYDSARLKHLELRKGVVVILDITIFPIKDESGKVTNAVVQHIDVTKEKQAEKALRKSEKKYRNIFNNAQVGIFRTRISDGKILECNDRFARTYGYETPEECMADFVVSEHYADPTIREKMMASLIEKGEVIDMEACFSRKNGDDVWIRFSARARPEEGYLEGVGYDITKEKSALEALRESEGKFRILSDQALMGIIILQEELFVYVNDRAAEIMEVPAEEIANWSLGDYAKLIHPDDLAFVMEQGRKKQTGEKDAVIHYNWRMVTPGGNLKWIEMWSKTIPFASRTADMVTIIDITERVQAEERLRESEEKYRQLSDSLPQIVFETDEKGDLTFTNRAAFDILGYTKEDFEKGLNALQMLIPEDQDRALKNIQRVLKGEKLEGTEYTALTKDGCRYPAMVYSTPMISEGKSVGMRGIVADLTEVKRSQKALLESEEKLARSKKMESLGLLAGGVAHDLNNILSGIVSYPELLLMDLPEDSPLRNPIKTIQESGMRAADVVEDLLTIARGVATGKEALNLNALITEYLGSAEYQKLEKTHSFVDFKTELDPDLLNMSGSPTHIKKILMNLVTNASEAIEGSGTVTIYTTNRYLDEPLNGYEDVRMGEYSVLSVLDNGSGISPEDLKRIFEPFYTKKVMGRIGTGLGLAVVWNTVQDHNGYINVKSGENGTIFELYFPTTREQVADEKEQVPLEDYLGHGEKILVVDDEERQREIAGGILTRLGYKAKTVAGGEEAIEYVKEHPVDLIVLDMVMPKGINGRETYEQIIKIRPGQKTIIASGYAKTKEVDAAQELGAGKYIKKPYTLEKVGLAVKEELEK